MERVKDPERFLRDLERPIPGVVRAPSQAEIDREGQDFMAFAAAFGVKPPTPSPGADGVAV